MITRFAPSPTGFLHLGHARAAYEAFQFAKQYEGTCLLRIEDIDFTRCKASYTEAIFEDLTWLGFIWPSPVRVQSAHSAEYETVLEQLRRKGLIYACRKTRREIQAEMNARNVTVYTRAAKDDRPPRSSEPAAWRLSLNACRDYLGGAYTRLEYQEFDEKGRLETKTVTPDIYGDVILARKDIGLSYHLAVTHDDAVQNISHIVRGEDFKTQTGLHVLIQKIMGWPHPIYKHHTLILREDGQKLAKRNRDPSIRAKRAIGWNAEQVMKSVL